MRRWAQLLTIVVLAAMTFGGSFTCKGSTHDDDDDTPTRPRRAAPAR